MMEGTMDNQLLQEVLQAVMELPCMKWCEGQMAQQEPAKLDEPAQMEEPKEESLDKPDEGEKEDEHVGPAKLKMQFDQEKIRYAKLDNEYKTLFAKVADLERKERIADRKSVLTQLFAEGFQFDLADELEMVADYEPAKFSKHVSWIKKNFRKAPIGVDIKTVSLPEEGGSVTPPALTPRDVMLQATEKAFAKYKN